MTNPADEMQLGLWVAAALGRLARQGLLETAAPAGDELAHASQRLLVETGWLDRDPFGPSQRLRVLLPPGVPLSSVAGFVDEQLSMALRYARGAAAGWSEEDPQLIRWRSAGSGPMVGRLFAKVFDGVPGFPERLGQPGAAFLDVGVGGGGICIAMCRTYPNLQAVGIDISEAIQETQATQGHRIRRRGRRADRKLLCGRTWIGAFADGRKVVLLRNFIAFPNPHRYLCGPAHPRRCLGARDHPIRHREG